MPDECAQGPALAAARVLSGSSGCSVPTWQLCSGTPTWPLCGSEDDQERSSDTLMTWGEGGGGCG